MVVDSCTITSQVDDATIQFEAPALVVEIHLDAEEKRTRAFKGALRCYDEAHRPPNQSDEHRITSEEHPHPRYHPRIVTQEVRRRQDMATHAVVNAKSRERFMLADACTELLDVWYADNREALTARLGIALDDLQTDCSRACIYQLNGGADVLNGVRNFVTTHLDNLTDKLDGLGRVPVFAAQLLGYRSVVQSYNQYLGLRSLIRAVDRDLPSFHQSRRTINRWHMDETALQINVTQIASFADRGCERALYFDATAVTKDERPKDMIARRIGVAWEEETTRIVERCADVRLVPVDELAREAYGDRTGFSQRLDDSNNVVRLVLASEFDAGRLRALCPATNPEQGGDARFQRLATDAEEGQPRAWMLHGKNVLKFGDNPSNQETWRDMFNLPPLPDHLPDPGSQQNFMRFGYFEPDYLVVKKRSDQVWEIIVMDVKANDEDKLTYAVQVVLYQRLLKRWLAHNGLGDKYIVSDRGGIWYLHEEWWSYLDDAMMQRGEDFFDRLTSPTGEAALMRIENRMRNPHDPHDPLRFQINESCSSCPYRGHCHSEVADDHVESLPNVSSEMRRLYRTSMSSHAGAGDIEDIPHNVIVNFSPGERADEDRFALKDLEHHARSREGRGGEHAAEASASAPPRGVALDHTSTFGKVTRPPFVFRALNLAGHKDMVRQWIQDHPNEMKDRFVVGIQDDGTDASRAAQPKQNQVFVLDDRGHEQAHTVRLIAHRLLEYKEEDSPNLVTLRFIDAQHNEFRARGSKRTGWSRRYSHLFMCNVSIQSSGISDGSSGEGFFVTEEGNAPWTRLRSERNAVSLRFAPEEIARCNSAADASLAPAGSSHAHTPLAPFRHASAANETPALARQSGSVARQLFPADPATARGSSPPAGVGAANGTSRRGAGAGSQAAVAPVLEDEHAEPGLHKVRNVSSAIVKGVPIFHDTAGKRGHLLASTSDVIICLSVVKNKQLGDPSSSFLKHFGVLVRFHGRGDECIERNVVLGHDRDARHKLVSFLYELLTDLSKHNEDIWHVALEGANEQMNDKEAKKEAKREYRTQALKVRMFVFDPIEESFLRKLLHEAAASGGEEARKARALVLSVAPDESVLGIRGYQSQVPTDADRPPDVVPLTCVSNHMLELCAVPAKYMTRMADYVRAFVSQHACPSSIDLDRLEDLVAMCGPHASAKSKSAANVDRAIVHRLRMLDRIVRLSSDAISWELRSPPRDYTNSCRIVEAVPIEREDPLPWQLDWMLNNEDQLNVEDPSDVRRARAEDKVAKGEVMSLSLEEFAQDRRQLFEANGNRCQGRTADGVQCTRPVARRSGADPAPGDAILCHQHARQVNDEPLLTGSAKFRCLNEIAYDMYVAEKDDLLLAFDHDVGRMEAAQFSQRTKEWVSNVKARESQFFSCIAKVDAPRCDREHLRVNLTLKWCRDSAFPNAMLPDQRFLLYFLGKPMQYKHGVLRNALESPFVLDSDGRPTDELLLPPILPCFNYNDSTGRTCPGFFSKPTGVLMQTPLQPELKQQRVEELRGFELENASSRRLTDSQMDVLARVIPGTPEKGTGERFIVVRGPPGTGKSTLIGELLAHYGDSIRRVFASAASTSAVAPPPPPPVILGLACFSYEAVCTLLKKTRPTDEVAYAFVCNDRGDAEAHRRSLPNHVSVFFMNDKAESGSKPRVRPHRYLGAGGDEPPGNDLRTRTISGWVDAQGPAGRRAVCIAGTGHQLRMAMAVKNERFSLLVLDEAGQMPLVEAAEVLRFVDPKAGRIVLVGDENQLPPVFKGNYPQRYESLRTPACRCPRTLGEEDDMSFASNNNRAVGISARFHGAAVNVYPDSDRPLRGADFVSSPQSVNRDALTGTAGDADFGQHIGSPTVPAGILLPASEFAFVKNNLPPNASIQEHILTHFTRPEDRERHVVQLQECFRMNSSLVAFFRAESLYGSQFVAHDDNAGLRLAVNDGAIRAKLAGLLGEGDPLFEEVRTNLMEILDPDRAFTQIVLQNMPPDDFASSSGIEAVLASTLAILLYECCDDAGKARFWQDKCFCVTPRNRQRHAVTRALCIHDEFKHVEPGTMRCGTVEKRQGAECDMVIVCCGTTSAETIRRNTEFWLNRNRFLVSFTRARKKTIALLNEALFDPSVVPNSDQKASAGYEFLAQCKRFYESNPRDGVVLTLDANAPWLQTLKRAIGEHARRNGPDAEASPLRRQRTSPV